MPVTVVADGEEKNIEDVGEVMITDDYHIAIIPKKANYLKAIQEGVADAHPEFKTKVLRMEEDEDSTNRHVDSINEMLEDKRKEIEEAYERYESTHGDDDQTEEEALTVMHSMRMSDVEE